jgi:hypothetical protein
LQFDARLAADCADKRGSDPKLLIGKLRNAFADLRDPHESAASFFLPLTHARDCSHPLADI